MRLDILFLFVCGSCAINLQIDGEVSFDLRLPNSSSQHSDHTLARDEVFEEKLVLRVEKSQVTAGPVMECIYQYPEKKQVDAILSNMMNVLTKVFVRAHDFFNNEDARRAPEDEVDIRHPAETRFRVIDKKKTQFFEHIYHNMTKEYSEFFNNSVERVDRSGRDPCQNQPEIKLMWRKLLDHSMTTFRRAALHCVAEHLRIRPSDEKVRRKLAHFLASELGKVRSSQLHLLCDEFQLCYNDLY